MIALKPAEYGFLLLTSKLGNSERRPLTVAQFRVLAGRMKQMGRSMEARDVEIRDFIAMGYSQDMSARMVSLLEDEALLRHYLSRGEKAGCTPITRTTQTYPGTLRRRLGLDAPGCLWAKGDVSLLATPMVALVGSRELQRENRDFAEELGRQAAIQGYTLVSGNARGADQTAQKACLRAGGRIISVVADGLTDKKSMENTLYLSEDCFDEGFSSQRALSRNRVIHGLGMGTFVAQCGLRTGGTWSGTVKNLRFGWSPVCCFGDGSEAAQLLEQMGARLVEIRELADLAAICLPEANLFDGI